MNQPLSQKSMARDNKCCTPVVKPCLNQSLKNLKGKSNGSALQNMWRPKQSASRCPLCWPMANIHTLTTPESHLFKRNHDVERMAEVKPSENHGLHGQGLSGRAALSAPAAWKEWSPSVLLWIAPPLNCTWSKYRQHLTFLKLLL